MNNEAFTAYPSEGELLLMEGCHVYVLAVEKGVQIANEHEGMQQYNGQTVTLIHLYHGW